MVSTVNVADGRGLSRSSTYMPLTDDAEMAELGGQDGEEDLDRTREYTTRRGPLQFDQGVEDYVWSTRSFKVAIDVRLTEGERTPVIVVDSHGGRFMHTALDVRLADSDDTHTTMRQSRQQRSEEWLQFTGGRIVESWMWLLQAEQLPAEAVKLKRP